MSSEDYQRLCAELDNMRHKNHPREYDTLSPEAKEALQYWIAHAIQPAQKVDEHHSSYGLKHDYTREAKVFVSNAQFKGAMLVAGYLPIAQGEQNWQFQIKPTHDERSFPRGVARQHERARLPTYRSMPQGEQNPHLHALVQKVLASHTNDDTYAVIL